MALLPDFLTRSIDRLAPDGSLAPTPLRSAAFGEPLVLLDRERCRFEFFPAPPGLKGGGLAAAARLHAQTRAPYEEAGYLLTRRGGDYGVWWWDAAWVAGMLGRHAIGAVRIWPETLAQPAAAEGWRIVRGASGYESQLWSAGFLVASAWRRRPYDENAWAAFARVQHHATVAAPSTPPLAAALPATLESSYRRRLVAARRAQDWAPLAATLAVAGLVGFTALSFGQGLRLAREHAALAARVIAAQGVAQASLRPRLSAETADLARLQALTRGPDPLTLVARAQAILDPFHLKISGFSANREEVSVVVAAEAVAGIDLISEELQASPWFTDIRPSLDRQKHQLTIRMAVRRG